MLRFYITKRINDLLILLCSLHLNLHLQVCVLNKMVLMMNNNFVCYSIFYLYRLISNLIKIHSFHIFVTYFLFKHYPMYSVLISYVTEYFSQVI